MSVASPLTLMLVCFPFCLSAAAITDVRRFIIPNWTSIALVASFFVCAVVSGMDVNTILSHVAVGAAALALGFGLFALGVWGGGDGKLIAATAIWFDPSAAMAFALNTTLAGGALGLFSLVAMMFHRRLGRYFGLDTPLLKRLRTKSPYGVAIAIGGVVTFPASSVFIALTQ